MWAIFSIILSYLIGSISFSYIFGKLIKKVDIRKYGSRNAGATNTLRVLGVGPAIAVLFLDCFKGICAVLIALAFTDGNTYVACFAGIAAIAGHNWPIFFGFRGGKGVATTIGVLASLVFLSALIAGIIAIISIFITRYVSLGSIIFIIGTTIFTWILRGNFGYPDYYTYFLIVISLLTIWRHRANIKRLIEGKESKIGEKVVLK